MSVPSVDRTRRLIHYFHDCLEGEVAHHASGDPFGKGQHRQQGLIMKSGPDLLTGGSGDSILRFRHTDLLSDMVAFQEFSSRYQLVRQDYQLMVGIVGLREHDSSRSTPGSPLFLAPLDHLPAHPEPDDILVNLHDLVGNPLFIDRLPHLESARLPMSQPQWRQFCEQLNGLAPPGFTEEHESVQVWLWLNRRSRLASGMLHELRELTSDSTALSAPVAAVLGVRDRKNETAAASAPQLLPTSLTKAQEAAILNGARFPLSVINGPPGTGKTHTIACQVMDAIINNRSTLVVCSNDQSADVVRERIAALLGGAEHIVLRPGRGNYQQQLVDQINQWLEGEQAPQRESKILARTTRRLQQTSKQYHHAERRFYGAIAAAEQSTDTRGGVIARLRQWWHAAQTRRSPLLVERWQNLQAAIVEHQDCMSRFLEQQLDERLSELLANHRGALATLSKAIRSRASHRRHERFSALDWSLVTRVFPVWVVSAADLSDTVPMTTGLFDLVIVDEATQCNLPQALPALQRGKRAVIVGDPKQLRHYSFLARKVQNESAAKHRLNDAPMDLDYRARSLLDYAIDALPDRCALSFLDEHFRSNPDLIDFSNELFYSGRIRILTAHRDNTLDKPLNTMPCPVEEKGNINMAEVEHVMSTLQALIRQHQASPAPPSIGVLGMVRATALVLEDRITRAISLEDISRHQLRVGTPYAFQGDERDIMLIASCAWPGQVHGTQRYLNREDVFNVAVTRARQRQIFFYGEGLLEAEPGMLASQYVHHGAQRQQQEERLAVTERAADPILEELCHWLTQRGLPARHNLHFAGQRIELSAEVNDNLVAFDLVGQTHSRCEVGKAWDPARYRLLERAGMVLAPIARQHWVERREEVLASLEQQLSLDEPAPSIGRQRNDRLHQRLTECTHLVAGEELPLPDVHEQLYKAGDLVVFWLNQHFQPEELTYQRFQQARTALMRQAERRLEGICLILESFRGLGAPDAMEGSIRLRLSECRQAVDALTNLGIELAELAPPDSDMDAAMDQVERLTQRVSDYQLN